MQTLAPTGTTALNTDQYELTMLAAALADGTAHKHATFEVFARSIPGSNAVFAGLERVFDAIERFRFDEGDIDWMLAEGIINPTTATYLRTFEFTGTVRSIDEGDTYLPYLPVITVEGTFGECVLLETIILSIVNHDSAVASTAATITAAANGTPIIEMGSRRTHDEAAVAAARACYIGGFTATSNLAAGRRWGVPTTGTAAHAWTLAHPGNGGEAAAFRAQLETQGVDTTLLVDTYNIAEGIRTAVNVAHEFGVAGPGAVRIDSGDLHNESVAARALLDRLGATGTRIVVSGDLDAERIADLEARNAPIDGYGVGTKAVSGLTAPGFVYKLVAIEDDNGSIVPVEKRAEGKRTVGGSKRVLKVVQAGTVTEAHIVPAEFAFEGDTATPATNTYRAAGVAVRPCTTTAARNTRTANATTPADSIKVVRYGL